MATIIDKRMCAHLDGDFAVFLIGMRINRWWKVHQWMPVIRAMPRMIRELENQPELGLLGYETWFGRTILMLQYWRSTDHLMDYARARESEHLPAWREFNRRVGKTGTVGIWHETYAVQAGAYESIYNHMPRFGLARAGELVEASGHRSTARGRLNAPQVHDEAA
jgi:hypothetical protein